MRFAFNTREVQKLGQDLFEAREGLDKPAKRVMTTSGRRVRNELRDNAQSRGRTKHFSRSITMDVYGSVSAFGQMMVEVGPDPSLPQGKLENLLYFEPSNFHLPEPLIAAEAELPRLARNIGYVAEDIV